MKLTIQGKDIRLAVLLALALLLVFGSLCAEQLAPNDPYATHVQQINQPASAEFPCGTDSLGRCVLSRVLYGARTSVFAALLLVGLTALFGSLVGTLCGYYSGPLDSVLMRVIDGVMAFPQMILAIAVAGILGGGMGHAMLALGFASWTPYARLARSRVLSLKREQFIMASRLAGATDAAIMGRHILPNIFGTLLTYATTQVGTMMLGFAGLSYLNLGVQLPQAEWGSMINEARGLLSLAPWTVLWPGLALVVTVMIFNYLGDAVRDRLDGVAPRQEGGAR